METGRFEIAGEPVEDRSRNGKWKVTVDDCGVIHVLGYCGSMTWPEVLEQVQRSLKETRRKKERKCMR